VDGVAVYLYESGIFPRQVLDGCCFIGKIGNKDKNEIDKCKRDQSSEEDLPNSFHVNETPLEE
jgi:hypothetical protein